MTWKQFLVVLAATKKRYRWYVTKCGQIRCGRGGSCRCPIEVVAEVGHGEYGKGAMILKFAKEVKRRTIMGADYGGARKSRQAMLRVLDLAA